MKKLILSIAFLGLGFVFVNAQTVTPAAQGKSSTVVKTTPAKADKKDAQADKKADAAKADAKVEKKTDANGVVLKKDGTPDKRYKGNKGAKGPMKKDGTPDMRYKANKEAKPASTNK